MAARPCHGRDVRCCRERVGHLLSRTQSGRAAARPGIRVRAGAGSGPSPAAAAADARREPGDSLSRRRGPRAATPRRSLLAQAAGGLLNPSRGMSAQWRGRARRSRRRRAAAGPRFLRRAAGRGRDRGIGPGPCQPGRAAAGSPPGPRSRLRAPGVLVRVSSSESAPALAVTGAPGDYTGEPRRKLLSPGQARTGSRPSLSYPRPFVSVPSEHRCCGLRAGRQTEPRRAQTCLSPSGARPRHSRPAGHGAGPGLGGGCLESLAML